MKDFGGGNDPGHGGGGNNHGSGGPGHNPGHGGGPGQGGQGPTAAAAAVPMVGVEGDLVMEALGTKLNYPRYLTYILQLGQFCYSN